MALNNTNSIKADLVIPTSASVSSIAATIVGDSVSKIPAMLPTTPLPLNVVASNVMYMYSCSQCEFKTPVEAVFKQHVDSIHLGLPVSSNVILGHAANTATVVANMPPSSVITQPQTIVMPHTGQLIAAAAEGQTTTIDKLHKCPKCNILLPSKNQLTLHKRKVHGKAALAAATGGAVSTSAVTYAVVASQPSSGVLATSLPLSVMHQAGQHATTVAGITGAGPTILSAGAGTVTTGTNLATGKKTYNCTACGYSTTRRDGLSQHYDSVHLKIKNHQCELCPYAASQKGTLNRHVKLRHKKREVLS